MVQMARIEEIDECYAICPQVGQHCRFVLHFGPEGGKSCIGGDCNQVNRGTLAWLLIEHGADVAAECKGRTTPLHLDVKR